MSEESVKLFISYSHKDEALQEQLVTHLAPLKKQKVIEAWHDRQIQAGMNWENQIDDKLNIADIVLLLISPDFVASDYCSNIEIEQAMKRHHDGEAIIIPVILEPCDWSWLPFAKFQAFPKDARAITTWDNQNEAFLDVAAGIRTVAQDLFAQRQQKLQKKEEAQKAYKEKVENMLSLDGKISLADRDTLDESRETLGLTKKEAEQIEERAYQPFKDRAEKQERYRKTLLKYIQNGNYPFSDEITSELEDRQRDLGLRPEDIEEITRPILAKAEATYQEMRAEATELQQPLELEVDIQRQLESQPQRQSFAYESELLRYEYEKEFSKAVAEEDPLTDYEVKATPTLRPSWELNAKAADRIEQPMLPEAEATYQETQAETAALQPPPELEAETQRQLESQPRRQPSAYESELPRYEYEKEFSKAVADEDPLTDYEVEATPNLRSSWELDTKVADRIEQPILAEVEAANLKRQIEAEQQLLIDQDWCGTKETRYSNDRHLRYTITLTNLIDDAKCYEIVRQFRWPNGVYCPKCESKAVTKRGVDERQPERQRYSCKGCGRKFDDLTDSVFARRQQPLRVWVGCLYLMGLNLSNQQIAHELDLHKDDVHWMTSELRQIIVDKKPEVQFSGEVEFDEVSITAGHKGQPEAVRNKGGKVVAGNSKGFGGEVRSKRKTRRSLA